jgi:hypothetical protein
MVAETSTANREAAVAAPTREVEQCPGCSTDLVVVPGAEICQHCSYLVLVLECGTCGATDQWYYGDGPRPRWVRLAVDRHRVMCCSAACAVLELGRLAEAGEVAVEPAVGPAAEQPAGPAPTPADRSAGTD